MQTKKGSWSHIPFLLPYLLIYAGMILYPVIRGIWISVHEARLQGLGDFVGLAQYREMLDDPEFWESLWNTCYFVLISTPPYVIIGLLLAMIVNSKIKGTTMLRTIFFMPNVLAVTIVASIWLSILRPYNGMFSSIQRMIGLENEILWLADANLAWFSISLTTLWWTVGFNMVLFMAGLQDIPDSYYEAAHMDGASAWQRFWNITLPSLKGVIILVTVLQTIASFKLFSQPWLMTQGGPGTATRPLVLYIYQKGFVYNDMGMASAMAYVLFAVMIVMAFIQFRVMSGKKKTGRL